MALLAKKQPKRWDLYGKDNKDMKISAYTTDEITLLKDKCNFSPSEMKIFELKAKDYSNVQIAMELGMSESSIAIAMRRIRDKVTFVMERHVQEMHSSVPLTGCDRRCPNVVYHTLVEWSRIPDFLSSRGVTYVYGDYRTETINGEEVNIPRIKYGDGVHSVSQLPFATMSIAESDMERWDNKPDTESNDFGKTIIIDPVIPRIISSYFRAMAMSAFRLTEIMKEKRQRLKYMGQASNSDLPLRNMPI